MASKLKHLLMIQRCIIIGLCIFSLKQVNNGKCITAVTVLQAKSDSDVMVVYKVVRNLESIDHLSMNPIGRIGLKHK